MSNFATTRGHLEDISRTSMGLLIDTFKLTVDISTRTSKVITNNCIYSRIFKYYALLTV